MKEQFIKAKSKKDAAINDFPQPAEKEAEGNTPESKVTVGITINTESWSVWEKLCCRLRDKFR